MSEESGFSVFAFMIRSEAIGTAKSRSEPASRRGLLHARGTRLHPSAGAGPVHRRQPHAPPAPPAPIPNPVAPHTEPQDWGGHKLPLRCCHLSRCGQAWRNLCGSLSYIRRD